MPKIYLMRHGETDWNLEKRLQGQRDIALNANGMQQMRELAVRLRDRGISFDRIVSSPLCRAWESAKTVASQTGYSVEDIVCEPFLKERDFGAAEGILYRERHTRSDGEWGMESIEELRFRALSGIKRHLGADRGNGVLFVVHGSVLKAALVALTEGKIEYNDVLQFRQGDISRLEYSGEHVTEIHMNLLGGSDSPVFLS